QTGDLFITSDTPLGTGSLVTRVHDPSGTPVVSTFIPPTGLTFAGLAFDSTGSILYVAEATTAAAFDRTGTQISGFAPALPDGPQGIVVAPPNTIVNGVDVSNNVFTNNAGTGPGTATISRIDVTAG